MSYAVESKKRKFHRVLESISKPLSSENTAKQPTPKPAPAAAARNHLPGDLSIKKVRLSSNDKSDFASVRSSILKTSLPSARVSSTSSSKRPTFVPWDRERFLERLETFRRVDRWTTKPSPINEVQWAKRGWICTDVMRVSCVSGCGGSVVVKVPDEIDELDGYDAEKVQERKQVRMKLVEEYEKLLKEAHGENCPWRNKSCDATIQHLPLTNPDTAIAGLRERYLGIAKLGDKLPADDVIQAPEGFDIEALIKVLPEDWSTDAKNPSDTNTAEGNAAGDQEEASQPSTPTPAVTISKSAARSTQHINRAAFALAFFGWNAVADAAAGLVGCKACFRRLGLWMYKPKENGDVTVYSSLEVATEHMEYCPWIDRLAQSGTGRASEKPEELRSGWEAVSEALRVKHRRHIRSTAFDSPRTERSTSPVETFGGEVDEEKKKKADREWWAKIRRMRQVLTPKTPRHNSTNSK
ncbi:hypothetical protein N7448_005133 [Penicillium atrosanguineum]|uniref:C3HC-type domain-containing protein n=1 Tax=Penicillium atrosanguineum TaxID=1132637 RepID=A0A9W9H2T2_9EURO|nr:general substrate transporter [Penicillium atrosanguineum]KAJ5136579.1 hypothetical protein N7448_005133 [Penicillium atrosanguineum]KAJ5292909.1 general substrate transporter [Penicillium atrosanguineum]KAJ5303053.1 hypothetical protein N7476_009852 [Penicillium atrosanguineum]